MKKNYYTPPHLQKVNGKQLLSMTFLSESFFESGLELLSLATEETKKRPNGENNDNSKKCFPSIIMFCTSFEAYMNETLERYKTFISKSDTETYIKNAETLDSIKNENEVKTKIKRFYKEFDKNSLGLELNSDLYQSLLALFRLRNEIIHYSPEMVECSKWPKRVREAFLKSNPKVKVNSNWTNSSGTVTVAEWAHKTVKTAIIEFARLSDAEDPFSENAHFGWMWWPKYLSNQIMKADEK